MCRRFLSIAVLCLLGPAWLPTPQQQQASTSTSTSTVPSKTAAVVFANAYRIGDVVDAAISTRSSRNMDLLVAHQPLFGVTKSFHLPGLQPERFSLSFEEGIFSLPYIDGATTEKVVVTFVYSKSGEGRIHSVTSRVFPLPPSHRTKNNNNNNNKREVEVLFEWVEEASVDLEAGFSAVFLVVFLVSIFFFLQLCSMDFEDNYDDDDKDGYGGRSSNSYYKGQ